MKPDTIFFRHNFGAVTEQVTDAQLHIIADMIKHFHSLPDTRNRAESLLQQAGAVKGGQVDQVKAIVKFAQRNIDFVKDPAYVEWVQSVSRTARRRMADCDCSLVYAGSLLASIGYRVAVVAVATDDRFQGLHNHVMLAVMFDPPLPKYGYNWVPIELTKPWPIGQMPPSYPPGSEKIVVVQ